AGCSAAQIGRPCDRPLLFYEKVLFRLTLRQQRLHPARRRAPAAPLFPAWATILGTLLPARMLCLAPGGLCGQSKQFINGHPEGLSAFSYFRAQHLNLFSFARLDLAIDLLLEPQ